MSAELAPVGNRNSLKTMMDQMRDSISDVIPKHLTPERVMKMALVAASRQPKLFQCTRESFLQSVMRASELGLDCSGTLGSGYLVPFLNKKINASECQFIPGYRGLIDLARRSGQIANIEARCVYEQDAFDVEYGTATKLVHKPYLGENPGTIRCVYAVARLVGQEEPQIEVMTRAQVDAIRKMSKAGEYGPWVDHYGEMARKTVVRRLCKYLPLSPELERAFAIEDEIEHRPEFARSVVSDMQASGTRTEQLEQQLAARKTETPPVDDPFGDPPPAEADAPPKRKRGRPRKTEQGTPPEDDEPINLTDLRIRCKRLCWQIGHRSDELAGVLVGYGVAIENETIKGLEPLTAAKLQELIAALEHVITVSAGAAAE